MKNIRTKWLSSCFLAALAIFGMASCSDDHFDVDTSATGSATGTLWDKISANPDLSDFASILERTHVNSKSYGRPSDITYKDLLSSSRSLTVWAPKNGTFDTTKWTSLLANKDNETVETQFVKNHIANFNHSGAYSADEHLTLLNNKVAYYLPAKSTFAGVVIDGSSVPATNGSLHVLEGVAPYDYNLREMMATNTNLSKMYQYLLDQDTLIFMPEFSVIGATVNGQVQYVDSFFLKSNEMLNLIATNEDSTVVAIYPSNNAWDKALDMISKYYRYHENNTYSYTDENNQVFKDSIDCDSLKELYTKEAIFMNMYYSLEEQPGFTVTDNITAADVKQFMQTTDSLISVDYYMRKNKLYYQYAPQCQALTEGKDPIKASNGYAFVTDNFNFLPWNAWQYDIILEAESGHILNKAETKLLATDAPDGERIAVTAANRNEAVSGVISGGEYRRYKAYSTSSKPTVSFNLQNVLAGVYDIYVVIVPENITDPTNTTPKANKFNATLKYDFDDAHNAQSVEFYADDKKSAFLSDPSKVDTICLAKNFEFPYCYAGVSNSAPILSLNVVLSVTDRKTCIPDLSIDNIILVAKGNKELAKPEDDANTDDEDESNVGE